MKSAYERLLRTQFIPRMLKSGPCNIIFAQQLHKFLTLYTSDHLRPILVCNQIYYDIMYTLRCEGI